MIYLYCLLGLALFVLFVLFFGGMLFSLSKRGTPGLEWRLRIGIAFDRYIAASLGYPDKMTICGYVGRRVQGSNNFSWKAYEKIIELLPWFYKGHCRETAEKEKEY